MIVQNGTSEGVQDGTSAKATQTFSMTGKPVLVQNDTGIYYGTLERLGTQNGICLLSNGYAVSPNKYLTYVQWARLCEGNPYVYNGKGKYFEHSYEVVRDIAQQNSITDYATEGIAPYYAVTDKSKLGESNTKFFADTRSVPLLSLTGVSVVVPIDDTASGVITVLDEDIEAAVPVLDTFSNAIFGTSHQAPTTSNETLERMEARWSETSMFGTTAINNLITVRGKISHEN